VALTVDILTFETELLQITRKTSIKFKLSSLGLYTWSRDFDIWPKH